MIICEKDNEPKNWQQCIDCGDSLCPVGWALILARANEFRLNKILVDGEQ